MASDYVSCKDLVLDELTVTLSSVQCGEIDKLMTEILQARRVFVVGVGRVMLMLQAFVKRLNHLGVESYYVGEINEPAISKDDLLIVGSGSGETVIPVSITKVAKKFSPKIAYIGSNCSSSVCKMADIRVRIPCRTKLGLQDEIKTQQPMSSLFEQSILLICDIVCLLIIERCHINMDKLWDKHANLE